MYRFILDTNIIVSSLLFKKSIPRQVLEIVKQEGVFLVSNETFTELHTVINLVNIFYQKKKRDF